MTTFTVSIPKELKEEIDKYPEVQLSEYLKKKFKERLQELYRFERLKNGGKL